MSERLGSQEGQLTHEFKASVHPLLLVLINLQQWRSHRILVKYKTSCREKILSNFPSDAVLGGLHTGGLYSRKIDNDGS